MGQMSTRSPFQTTSKAAFAVLIAGLLLSAPVLAAAPAGGSSVLCAVDPGSGAQAWISAEAGLVLLGWPGAKPERLSLGRAGYPRFLADGRFVYQTSLGDDGHELSATVVSVVDPGSVVPRPPQAGEHLGHWTPPARSAAAGGVLRVCIDAGHGGSDPGASGNGLQEKDVALDVALRLADLLATDTGDTSGGGAWDVLLTRVDDSEVTLVERVTMANAFSADSFVSIHANAFADPTANGTETYAWAEGTVAAQLRDRVHARMLQAWGLADRGTKTAGFYVLLNTTMPASLSEMGFITNPGDAALLGDAEARESMALAHLFAVQEHHGFTIHEPSLFTILAGGTYGTLGKPALVPKGPLTAGSTFSMKVVDAAPDAPAVLFFGFQSVPAPFFGGQLYPFPAPRLLTLVIDASGGAQGSGEWPAGVPSGTQVWFQLAVVDALVPDHGVALSDALVGLAP
jgi:N-acetylmuramoyl-L-alanine amidase